ncbi:hypothetical protein I302_106158 [Kwoniella bestiolae CBS 10118]|uniref:Transcription initiation factor TFIID subunit 13 n=1 Tax=Kwoniella bestiolae CBS 10118 TaxID=1296100 RepID=A0A1B9G380_9TREE|nr:hypothetical protein I302_05281 [Kwoniella bestiolae CBS 10118]OCF25461.1 hypothetical protein I302_05281 [Kwoniella bestiolae CBS 10118]
MSQFPNNFNQQAFFGQARPNMNNPNGNATGSPNPNMNTPSPMMGSIRPTALQNFNSPTASPTPNRPHQFNSTQLATLTDFHQRQQALLAVQQAQAQARLQAQASGQSPNLGQAQPRPTLQAMQQVLQQRLQAQQQQNALQQFLQSSNQNQSITPSQLQNQTNPQAPALPLGHQAITPSTIAPQLPAPPRPISQNPAFNPALLNAAKIAQNTISNSNLNSNINPAAISSPQLTNTATVPLTQTFTPPPEGIPRLPSPVKADTKLPSEKKDKEDVAEKKEAKPEEKEKKKKAPRKKKEKKEDANKDKADGDKEKEKEKDEGKDSNAATPTEKPVKPKKPRTEEEKAKRAEARRKKIAADKEKAAAAAAAAQGEDGDAAVFSAGPASTSKDASSTEAKDKDGSKDDTSKDKEKEKEKEVVVKAPEPKTTASAAANATETRSRRQEGMRGSMRNEIARLMYGAGDVPEPDIDTVDYMEDMVVEFLADLCRPIPPLRPTGNSTSQPLTVPLSFDIIRHRLTHPTYSKYLERFDHMVYMSEVLKQHRRIANPNLNDLVETVGNDYLGLDDDQQLNGNNKRAGDGTDERGRKRGRPLTKVLKEKGEKRKPGPQKGWKLNRVLDPDNPQPRKISGQKRKYQRKPGANPPGGGGVKREGSLANV